jgi:hypothetical protein
MLWSDFRRRDFDISGGNLQIHVSSPPFSNGRHGTFDPAASRGEQVTHGLVATAGAADHAAQRIEPGHARRCPHLPLQAAESSSWQRVTALLLSAARSDEVDVADVTIALEMAASMEEGPQEPEPK